MVLQVPQNSTVLCSYDTFAELSNLCTIKLPKFFYRLQDAEAFSPCYNRHSRMLPIYEGGPLGTGAQTIPVLLLLSAASQHWATEPSSRQDDRKARAEVVPVILAIIHWSAIRPWTICKYMSLRVLQSVAMTSKSPLSLAGQHNAVEGSWKQGRSVWRGARKGMRRRVLWKWWRGWRRIAWWVIWICISGAERYEQGRSWEVKETDKRRENNKWGISASTYTRVEYRLQLFEGFLGSYQIIASDDLIRKRGLVDLFIHLFWLRLLIGVRHWLVSLGTTSLLKPFFKG
jgi:hypothetical protein